MYLKRNVSLYVKEYRWVGYLFSNKSTWAINSDTSSAIPNDYSSLGRYAGGEGSNILVDPDKYRRR
jgi:hypothetical protein